MQWGGSEYTDKGVVCRGTHTYIYTDEAVDEVDYAVAAAAFDGDDAIPSRHNYHHHISDHDGNTGTQYNTHTHTHTYTGIERCSL